MGTPLKWGFMTRFQGIVAAALLPALLMTAPSLTIAGEGKPSDVSSKKATVRYARASRPLEVNIYARRRGGYYSYRAFDTISTYRSSPPPYLDVRQTPSGPFDTGFFFDSAIAPRGGFAPYPN